MNTNKPQIQSSPYPPLQASLTDCNVLSQIPQSVKPVWFWYYVALPYQCDYQNHHHQLMKVYINVELSYHSDFQNHHHRLINVSEPSLSQSLTARLLSSRAVRAAKK